MRRRSWVVLLLACLCVASAGCAGCKDGVALDLLRGFVPGIEWGVSRTN
jgi:hypothetical protein